MLIVWFLISATAPTALVELINSFNPLGTLTFYYFKGLANYTNLIIYSMLGPLFLFYLMSVTGKLNDYSKGLKFVILLPCIIIEFFKVTNPIFGLAYYFDSDQVFIPKAPFFAAYYVNIFYLVFSLIFLFRYWMVNTRKRKIILIYSYGIAIVGGLIEHALITVRCELACFALALIGILIAVENEDERIDITTGVYNRFAFETDVEKYFMLNKRFEVIFSKSSNAESIIRTMDNEVLVGILKSLLSYVEQFVKKHQIYLVSKDTIVIIVEKGNAKELADNLAVRLNEKWTYRDFDVQFDSQFVCASVPDDIKTPLELMALTYIPFPKVADNRVLDGSDLDFMIRRMKVETAIGQGGFEVFYQPTYDIRSGKIYGAEALARLRTDELGYIPPDEFIPIAENMGKIDEIGDSVLKQTCEFLKSGIVEECQMKMINVNLSILQCMRHGFVERIVEIVDEYGIDHKCIGFEITESVTADDYDKIASVVSELKERGFSIYMDDFGTGYSNVQSMFELDFDVVKIDKSILWGAFANNTGRVILENSIRMIHQTDRKALVEGVETKEHVEFLRSLGVDFLQGYYFSKPVPPSEYKSGNINTFLFA